MGALLEEEHDSMEVLPDTSSERVPLTKQSSARTSSLRSRRCSSSPNRCYSVPALTHRLSQRVHEAFKRPTTRHGGSVHSRPSFESIGQCASTPVDGPKSVGSTLQSGSYVMLNGGCSSTPLTSDSMPTSPNSRMRIASLGVSDNHKALAISNLEMERRRLSPIAEADAHPRVTIATIEAAAITKIFFETHFNRILFGPRPRSLRRKEFVTKLNGIGLPVESRERGLRLWHRHQSDQLRQERVLGTQGSEQKSRLGLSVTGYEAIRVLGKGSFGVVRLVRETHNSGKKLESTSKTRSVRLVASKPSENMSERLSTPPEDLSAMSSNNHNSSRARRRVFAMKVIRKSIMVRNSQEGHIRAERDFLVASEGSKWIIPLMAAFEDSRHLYLVMEFCIGGDFLGLLIRKTVLSEEVTRWYIAEMILCVEEAHRMKWIHRDVKPDNFLIGADGHLKISDFGLAFDGDWCHDQNYYHKHRHSLIERLGFEVKGDHDDQVDGENSMAADRVGFLLTEQTGKIPNKSQIIHVPHDEEPILNWRNREQRRHLAKSVVGTSQYMAPEVIRGDLYDGRCD